MTKGKRVILPVSNDELKHEAHKGVSVLDLADKYKCATSVIYRRLHERDKYEKIDLNKVSGLEIINLADAMNITGLSRYILTKMAKNGDIPNKKLGSKYMFQLKDVYKIIGMDLNNVENLKYTEMDILKENKEKSENIEYNISQLINEVQNLKQSVRNENKESYDMEVMKALKIINESQNKINDTILKMNEKQNKLEVEISNINIEMNKLNIKEKIDIKPDIKPKNHNPLDKFGGR